MLPLGKKSLAEIQNLPDAADRVKAAASLLEFILCAIDPGAFDDFARSLPIGELVARNRRKLLRYNDVLFALRVRHELEHTRATGTGVGPAEVARASSHLLSAITNLLPVLDAELQRDVEGIKSRGAASETTATDSGIGLKASRPRPRAASVERSRRWSSANALVGLAFFAMIAYLAVLATASRYGSTTPRDDRGVRTREGAPPHSDQPGAAPKPDPPGADPPSVAGAYATFSEGRANPSARRQDEDGVEIRHRIRVVGMLDKEVEVSCYFYDAGGNALRDLNQSYRSTDGQVSIGKKAMVTYRDAIFREFILFIPLSELHAPAGEQQVAVNCEAFDSGRSVGKSDWLKFTVVARSPQIRPSFSCGAARSRVELLICGSPELAALDRRMADAYVAARKGPGATREVQGAQRRWLQSRDACPDSACIAKRYRERIAQLE